jgi:hypothetical protein
LTPSAHVGIGCSVPGDAKPNKKPRADAAPRGDDRMPTNAELLHELRQHGAKPPPRPLPGVSRRTRDFLLIAGVGSAGIAFVCFRLLQGSDPAAALKLAATGIIVFCGLLWFIFYGVMNRY